jgi:hypothetical protein
VLGILLMAAVSDAMSNASLANGLRIIGAPWRTRMPADLSCAMAAFWVAVAPSGQVIPLSETMALRTAATARLSRRQELWCRAAGGRELRRYDRSRRSRSASPCRARAMRL